MEEEEWRDCVPWATTVKGVRSLGEHAVMTRVDTNTVPNRHRPFDRALWQRLKGALDEAGIEMPHRQLDVWMRAQPEAA